MQSVVEHELRVAGDGGPASVCEVLAGLEPGVLAMAYLRSLAGSSTPPTGWR
jgi:hypothetical protein